MPFQIQLKSGNTLMFASKVYNDEDREELEKRLDKILEISSYSALPMTNYKGVFCLVPASLIRNSVIEFVESE